eukprot:TRINITY_DN5846_c0_g1_i1.p1 TRINITY_DN5846_c0_g1~~TRINITY_DN5846_c0_g1_i1.p1  ORF type:complete len:359 (-),score=125.89 TRINITY_DN5846_c0_g1_i1:389-1465(-)
MKEYTASWRLVSSSPSDWNRSSQCLSVVGDNAFIFNGEREPRQPADLGENESRVLIVDLKKNQSSVSLASGGFKPESRVGAASAVLNDKVYMWGGRGGKEMTALESSGPFSFVASPERISWEKEEKEGEKPCEKSYHVMTSSEMHSLLFIHAGCLAQGRTSNLHSFSPSENRWRSLADAPEPGRGGTGLTTVKLNDKEFLLRWGGFAGYELGADNHLDVYDIASNEWKTYVPKADELNGTPGPRSVHGFVSAKGDGGQIAVLFYGERDASSLGHAGAGTFWDDVWVLLFEEPVKDSDNSSGGFSWKKANVRSGESFPSERGWFACSSWKEGSQEKIVMHGGLLPSNDRSSELWVLEIQ